MLLFAGLVDMALLLYPVRFGDVDWEFGVLSQAIDALPLSTVGAILLSSGVRALGRPTLTRVTAILFFVAALALGMVLVILALAFGSALDAMNDPQAAPAIKRILFKAGVNGLAYLSGYFILGIMLWRSTRPRRTRI